MPLPWDRRYTWANDPYWQSLPGPNRAAAMALLEADRRDPQSARNALGAMINRADKSGEDLGQHVSRSIYQPITERGQYGRLRSVTGSPQYQELTDLANRRLSGQEPDWVSGATHFLAPERVMEGLTAREPNKYRSWPQWTGYDPNTRQYRDVVMRDPSHAFLAPEGRHSAVFGQGPQAPMGAPSMPDIMTAQRPPLPEEWGPPMGLGAGAPPAQGPGAVASFLSNLFGGQGQAVPPPAAPPPQDMPPPPPQAPPISAMGPPDMAPGPEPAPPAPGLPTRVGMPPAQFPPIGDLSGFGFKPPPSLADMGAGYGPTPGQAQPFPTGTNVPPSPGVSVPPVAPATDTGPASPVAPAAVERRGPQGGGMAPQMGGGSLLGRMLGNESFSQGIQGALANPLTGAGFQLLFPGSQAGGTLATAGMRAGAERRAESEEYRKQTEFSRTEDEAQRKIASWQKLFPGGGDQMNKDHPLAKGLPEQLGPVVQALGPEQGVALLAKYQLMDAEKRADMERKLGFIGQLSGGGIGGPAPAAAPAQAPAGPAAPFTAPPSGPVGQQFAPISATGMYNAVGDLGPPAPRAAAASPAPTAQPQVMAFGRMRTLPEAEAIAQAAEAGGIPAGELRQSITRAAAAGQEAATTKAKLDVQQEQEKPRARLATTNVIDKLNATEALATKISSDPRLWWTTGNLSSTGPGGEKRPFSSLRSDTRATEADINTLIAQVGLSTLQAMREGSKTGSSGMGGTSDTEINMLSNALTALKDTSISTEAYQQNLQIVKDVVGSVRQRMMGAWRETYGEDFKPSSDLPQYPTKSVAQMREEESKAARKERKAARQPGAAEAEAAGLPRPMPGMIQQDDEGNRYKLKRGKKPTDPDAWEKL